MKNVQYLFIILSLSTQIVLFSQETEKLSLNKGTIENQFNYTISKSNSYKDNKVIKKSWIYTLKAHVLDSLAKEKATIKEANKIIEKQKTDFINLQNNLNEINKNLKEVTNSKDTIALLGLRVKKSVFKTIMSFIIALLFFAFLYVLFLFKKSNTITKKTLSDYNELDTEFNLARTRALEREQSLNRKLQDEINKQKK